MPDAATAMHDLEDRDDVALLVSSFYRRAFADPLIGPIFTDVAHMDLDHHLPIMCDFWQTVLFNAGLYRRNALQLHSVLHAKHPLGEDEFERWLEIWVANVDDHFAGAVAEHAKVQAARIAGSIERRLQGRSGSRYETIGYRDGQDLDGPRLDGQGSDEPSLGGQRSDEPSLGGQGSDEPSLGGQRSGDQAPDEFEAEPVGTHRAETQHEATQRAREST
ncbi:group III truncated hemoglobin [Rathayibacter sp. CAU 1779]